MPPKPILLLFGIGPRTGAFIATKFANAGYNIAAIGRSLKEGPQDNGYLNIKADLGNPDVVSEAFSKVKAHFGSPPNVVVYNAYSTAKVDPTNPFSAAVSDIQHDLNVNIASLYAAGAEAVKGFAELPANVAKTFIFVGNKQNHFIFPPLVSLGMGKCAAAHLMEVGAKVFGEKGYSFYYADERTESGAPVFGDIDGDVHGDFFLELAEEKKQVPWEATFVKGKGYVQF